MIVVCFKNGKEVTRVSCNTNTNFPGGKKAFAAWVEANWRRNGFVTYRLKEIVNAT